MNKKASRVLSTILALCLTAAIAIPALADGENVMAELWRNITVYVDGEKISDDSFIVDDTTYIPARTVAETLGSQVGWNEETRRVYIDSVKTDPKAAEYLEEYFEIAPLTGTVSRETFDSALAAIFGEDAKTAESEDALTVAEAVKTVVDYCGLKELAACYSAEVAANTTAGCANIPADYTSAVAAALDAAVASGTWEFAAELNGDVATQLLMNAVNVAGLGRNYLGNISDTDIAAKLQIGRAHV